MTVSRRDLLATPAAALAIGGAAMSQEANAQPSAAVANAAGWNEFIESLRTLPERMLAKLPEAQRADPQIQQECARLALEALASSALETIGADGDRPVFLPSLGQVLNVGQPNADTVYRSARVTPGGVYRIRGQRGSLRIASIGQVQPRGQETASSRAYLNINELHVDAHGHFDVLLSPTKPADYHGEWWELRPGANRLLVRFVSSDWAHEISPTLSIERIDIPVASPRRPAADLEARLRALPIALNFLAPMFVDHVQKRRDEGILNRLAQFDVPAQGGLTGQFYYEGAFELNEDEALIVEVRPPEHCVYRSLILTNEIYETIDWYNNHSSLNDEQADVDHDGVLRIVISPRDPGVKNWLDTAGHARGLIQGRWTDADSHPVPNVRKVRLDELAGALPTNIRRVTPEERQEILRARRSALQQRPLW